jgi:hypothetical protein
MTKPEPPHGAFGEYRKSAQTKPEPLPRRRFTMGLLPQVKQPSLPPRTKKASESADREV